MGKKNHQDEYIQMIKKLTIYYLAIKYWYCGDDWEYAKEFARFVVNGFRIK